MEVHVVSICNSLHPRIATNSPRFGTSALMLQLVPVLSMFFLLTTTVGSALMVVHMEERGNPVDDDEGPAYIDHPPRPSQSQSLSQSQSYGTLV